MNSELRERTRNTVRAAVAADVCDIFAEHGFDSLSVDDVARRAGVSRATFFRYFGSKEDAVISVAPSGREAAEVLSELQVRQGETAWQLIRRAFEPAVEVAEVDGVRLRARIRLISSTPALRASMTARHAEHAARFGEELSRRLADPLDGRLFAAAGFAAMDTAWGVWSEMQQEASFRAVVDNVFARAGRLDRATVR